MASFWLPRKLTPPYSWVEHIPFAFWLVSVLRPARVVELGVHTGNSYFAFCQAIQDLQLESRSYAVDTWRGDKHSSFYEEQVFEEFVHYHAAEYSTFSVFLRGLFDDALEQFNDGSIDLLHIDGLHTYEAARHDLDLWLPKMSRQGVILLHDTNIRGHEFGVYRLWEEISQRFPHFAFPHGYGLGVLGVGVAIPLPVKGLLSIKSDSVLAQEIRAAYAKLGAHIDLMTMIRDRSEELDRLNSKITNQAADLERAEERTRSLEASVQALRRFRSDAEEKASATAVALKQERPMPASVSVVAQYTSLAEPPAIDLHSSGVNLSEDRSIVQESRKMSIVVCVHNALEDVQRCLETVIEHSREPHEVILVDDGSEQQTRDLLEGFAKEWSFTLIRHDAARGYTISANEGIQASSGEYVVLLNSDTIVTSGWLEAIELVFEKHPRTGIVGPLSNTASWQSVPMVHEGGDWAKNSIPANLSVADVGRFVSERRPQHHRLPFINGFCFAVRKDVFAEIGLFDAKSFPTGYGEENDFCIRARKKGWELRVADNCYVWHAQSRSFSHEHRRRVYADASQTLAQLHHEQTEITLPASFCHASLGMQGVREWVQQRFERELLIQEMHGRYAGARIAFIFPAERIAGGANVIFQEARALQRFGIDVSLVNLEDRRRKVFTSYPEYRDRWMFATDIEDIHAVIRGNGPFDAVISTAYMSTFWTPKQEELPVETRSAYYVQDFEPLFYENDLGRLYALASYRWDLKQVLFTKTAWNRDIIVAETGRIPQVIGPSVDVDLFQPVDRSATWPPPGGIRICAMIRPDTPYRAPESSYRLLSRIALQFGRLVECHTFGCTEQQMEHYRAQYPGQVFHHGLVDWREMHRFLSAMDVFFDLSLWQAMGLTLLEAMASGLFVVGPANGGATEIITHGQNGFLVDTVGGDAAFVVVEQILRNEVDVMAVRRNAITTAHSYYPEKAAAALVSAVLPKARSVGGPPGLR